ncbi:MAG: hypothetical protein BGO92_15000 [Magnetospirillum sp. 64-120]|nr:MAG: hypothetical protein BGO92_15000 [Magnetospirillum sp. 64-120]
MSKGRSSFALVLAAAVLLTGCASRRDKAAELASGHGMHPVVFNGGTFDLYTQLPPRFQAGQPLSVYIEGDGYAYVSRQRLNDDPTPREAVALDMAVRDSAPNVVYLARPCQYVSGSQRRNCQPAYWSIARYSENVIASTNQVIDQLMARSGARGLRLYGHSGGATVALLVAARRQDVISVMTAAGLLDTEAWTTMDGLAPLVHSLNPADQTQRLAAIPQLHLLGGDDDVIAPAVAQSYAARFPTGQQPRLQIVPGQTHTCCWAEHWPEFLRARP